MRSSIAIQSCGRRAVRDAVCASQAASRLKPVCASLPRAVLEGGILAPYDERNPKLTAIVSGMLNMRHVHRHGRRAEALTAPFNMNFASIFGLICQSTWSTPSAHQIFQIASTDLSTTRASSRSPPAA